MKTSAKARHAVAVAVVAAIWTLVVMAFSTTMGERPLRIYDWGPPVFAAVMTLCAMAWERRASRSA